MSGEGEPIKKKIEDEAFPKIIEFENFPFVSQKAYAGYLSGWADEEYVESLPTVAFPVDHTPLGKYLVFEVKGDSMDDGSDEAYKEGDRLLCREVRKEYWIDSKLHIKKWDFVIVHKEGILIKSNISFYSARKTFSQFAFDLGIRTEIVEYCLGQSMKENRPIYNYVRVMQRQADAAIKMVIDYTNNPYKYELNILVG